jgi:hypothetical protein
MKLLHCCAVGYAHGPPTFLLPAAAPISWDPIPAAPLCSRGVFVLLKLIKLGSAPEVAFLGEQVSWQC